VVKSIWILFCVWRMLGKPPGKAARRRVAGLSVRQEIIAQFAG
jgi:hypothetical protein